MIENAITRELAISFMEDNRDRLSSLIESSYNHRGANKMLLEKDHLGEDNPRKNLLEPLI